MKKVSHYSVIYICVAALVGCAQHDELIRARSLITSHQYGSALEKLSYAESYRGSTPYGVEIAYLKAYSYEKLGRNSDAIRTFKYLMERYPDTSYAYQAKERLKILMKISLNKKLIEAVREGRNDQIEALLASGADVNTKDHENNTPLIWAIRRSDPETAKLLITRGADVNLGIRPDFNALMLAKRKHSNKKTADSAAIIELLTAAGAKPIKVKEEELIANKTSKTPKLKASKRLKKSTSKGPTIKSTTKSKDKKEGRTVKSLSLYNNYQRPELIFLYNKDGKLIAKKKIEYSKYNSSLKAKETILNKNSDKVIYTINYDAYGKPSNNKWLCLDKNGNMVAKKGKPVLVKTFRAIQKMVTRFSYSGSFRTGANAKIFPCENCAKETGIKNCAYVW